MWRACTPYTVSSATISGPPSFFQRSRNWATLCGHQSQRRLVRDARTRVFLVFLVLPLSRAPTGLYGFHCFASLSSLITVIRHTNKNYNSCCVCVCVPLFRPVNRKRHENNDYSPIPVVLIVDSILSRFFFMIIIYHISVFCVICCATID